MTTSGTIKPPVPDSERCSRCGRPYSEHAHSGAEFIERSNAGEGFFHAFRRQPGENGMPHLTGQWVGRSWWPDGRWDR